MSLDRYRYVAPIYDGLATFYSYGQIWACKTAFLTTIQPGDKVLFAGVGHGRDAVLAAQRGARVVAIDLSAAMLRYARQTQPQPELPLSLIQGKVQQLTCYDYFDVVVANFFLNVFDEASMLIILTHLARLLRPGGQLIIGDFAPAHSALGPQIFQTLYWQLPLMVFWLATGNAWHPIYDYPRYFAARSLTLTHQKDFQVAFGIPSYRAILARKAD